MIKHIRIFRAIVSIFVMHTYAHGLTQQQRNEMAAKLIPIYMILLEDTTTLQNNDINSSSQFDAIVGKPYQFKSMLGSRLGRGAPDGMTINLKTGLLTWTPSPDQTGDIDFDIIKIDGTIESITIKVGGNSDIKLNHAIFVSTNGNNDNNRSASSPLANLKKLCKRGTVLDNQTIYIRGGSYYNFPMIRCSGTAKHPLVIRPWGNETAKFIFDGSVGIRLEGNYTELTGVEVEGISQKINLNDAVANWWRGDRYYNGSGIVAAGHHIEISECVVHDIPGSGISCTRGDYFNLHNNIVYNADWWTIAGSKGIGITDAISSDKKGYIKIENNLIFNVESRIYSRVWSKGFSRLDLDEGEGILVQANDGNYTGRYTIKDNFLLFDGKGIVVNKTDNVDVVHNTLYHTGTTISGKFKGIRASLTSNSTFMNNAVQIIGNGYSFNFGKSNNESIERYGNCGNGGENLTGVEIKDTIFVDAHNFDFSPMNGCTGADVAIWNSLKQKADKLGINIIPTNWVPDHKAITKGVLDSIPSDTTVSWENWSDSHEFNVSLTHLPNNGIKGRPEHFRLEVVHPFWLPSKILSFYAWDGVVNYDKLPMTEFVFGAPTLYLNPVDHGQNLFVDNAIKVIDRNGSIWLLMSGNPPDDYLDRQIDLMDEVNKYSGNSILGMAFDLEPWSQFSEQNKSENRETWKKWLDTLASYRNKLEARGYKISITIPFWLYNISEAWPNDRPLDYDVLDIADEVIIMDYTIYSDRFLIYAEHTLHYADTHKKKVKLAIEMTDIGNNGVSFYSIPDKIDRILDLNISHDSFDGFVVHTLDAYVNIKK